MVGIGPIDFIDEAKIRFFVCGKSRRFRERRHDLATHCLPKHLDATHDRRGGTTRPAEYLSRFKWTALSHIVPSILHGLENLVRDFRAAGLAEGFGKITGFRGMTAVQEKPKQVRRVSEARHYHLCLKRIESKKRLRHTYQRTRGRKQAQSV